MFMNTTWDDLTIGWLAGVIDGEGTFVLNSSGRTRCNPSVKVAMTDEDTIRRLQEVSGIGQVNGPYSDGGRHTPLWHWTVGRKAHVARLLLCIYPLLSERRQGQVARVVYGVHWPMYQRVPK